MEQLREFMNSPQTLPLPFLYNTESQLLKIKQMDMLKISISRRQLWKSFEIKCIQMRWNYALVKTFRISMTIATMIAVCF